MWFASKTWLSTSSKLGYIFDYFRMCACTHTHTASHQLYIHSCKQGGLQNPEAGTQHTFLLTSRAGVGSCALHEIDARSLLRHPEHCNLQKRSAPFYHPSSFQDHFPLHVPLPRVWNQVLGAQLFRTIALMEFVLKKRAISSALLMSLPTNASQLSLNYFQQFPIHPRCVLVPS